MDKASGAGGTKAQKSIFFIEVLEKRENLSEFVKIFKFYNHIPIESKIWES